MDVDDGGVVPSGPPLELTLGLLVGDKGAVEDGPVLEGIDKRDNCGFTGAVLEVLGIGTALVVVVFVEGT